MEQVSHVALAVLAAFDSPFVLPLRQRHRGPEGDAAMDATSLNTALNRPHDKPGEHCRRFTPHDSCQRMKRQRRTAGQVGDG